MMSDEQHCALKLPVSREDAQDLVDVLTQELSTKKQTVHVTLDVARGLWHELPEKKRLEVLRSVIYLAPDARGFYEKVLRMLQSTAFEETID